MEGSAQAEGSVQVEGSAQAEGSVQVEGSAQVIFLEKLVQVQFFSRRKWW